MSVRKVLLGIPLSSREASLSFDCETHVLFYPTDAQAMLLCYVSVAWATTQAIAHEKIVDLAFPWKDSLWRGQTIMMILPRRLIGVFLFAAVVEASVSADVVVETTTTTLEEKTGDLAAAAAASTTSNNDAPPITKSNNETLSNAGQSQGEAISAKNYDFSLSFVENKVYDVIAVTDWYGLADPMAVAEDAIFLEELEKLGRKVERISIHDEEFDWRTTKSVVIRSAWAKVSTL